MGFFDRMKTLVKGKANQAMDKLEDKNIEAIVKEEIRKMKGEFRQAKSAVAKSITLVKEAETKANKAKEELEHWADRAKQALEAGNEDLARKAIEKKQEAEKDYKKYQEQVVERRRIADIHKAKVKELQKRIEEAEDRQDELIAAAESARATKEINETMSGLGKENASDNLDRLEKRVGKMEAEAQASDELYEDLKKDDLEAQFEELENKDSIDDELAKLKAEMNKNE
ncbi:PspA/IM30 family protein [Halocella sp. SP3-1]|uniref:PspA/IM30 family protein n=1 Tax=Halocella sp. SP3-1 TaxID=2382161 RepID=UPI000F75727F|nr:PspA/IM30 family protein [Halocella sp. SP3-1]AZO93542.1 PspA/IM30 family protein [Halocella sp. SP3-1]